MNQCVVNIQGYIRLKVKGVEEKVLPFIAKDGDGVYYVNSHGNVLHLSNDLLEILWCSETVL